MSVVRTELRRGTYLDSVVLMQVQRALLGEEGVEEAGVVMATAANREVLRQAGLWSAAADAARVDDLLVAVRARDAATADAALARVDELLAARAGGGGGGGDYRFKSLAAALRDRPQARWVLVSVPGPHAAAVADEALDAGRHVFLYSDNVPLAEERRLKLRARDAGLLVLGPDCGTAIVGGVGLGFANRVGRGAIGVVAASGTGLQAVVSEIDRRGVGVSQAIGVGGRDLSAEIAGLSTLAALELFRRDDATRVVVLISKPPDAATCARVLAAASRLGKPVVACFQGLPTVVRRLRGVHLANGLADAARLAVELLEAGRQQAAEGETPSSAEPAEPRRRYLRGLFAGGTLAQELQLALVPILHPLASNAPVAGVRRLDDPLRSIAHSVVDMGADELTVGRPHPMLDPADRVARLRRELADPEVAVVVIDVVLGDGSHDDPAAELAATVRAAGEAAPPVLAWVVGTAPDPQGLEGQVATLEAAGLRVHRGLQELIDELLPLLPRENLEIAAAEVDLAALEEVAAINVGVEPFAAALEAQGAAVTRVEWRPPAGGDEKLAGILARLRARQTGESG